MPARKPPNLLDARAHPLGVGVELRCVESPTPARLIESLAASRCSYAHHQGRCGAIPYLRLRGRFFLRSAYHRFLIPRAGPH